MVSLNFSFENRTNHVSSKSDQEDSTEELEEKKDLNSHVNVGCVSKPESHRLSSSQDYSLNDQLFHHKRPVTPMVSLYVDYF